MVLNGKTAKRVFAVAFAAVLALALAPGLALADEEAEGAEGALQALPPTQTDKLAELGTMASPVSTVADAVNNVLDQLGIGGDDNGSDTGDAGEEGLVSDIATRINDAIDEELNGGDENTNSTVSSQAGETDSTSGSDSTSDSSGSSTSTATTTGTTHLPEAKNPHTLVWANTSADAKSWFNDEQAYLANCKTELLSVKLASGTTLKAADIPETAGSDNVSYSKGVLDAPAGSTIMVRMTPARGYQLNKQTICNGAIKVTAIDEEDEDVGKFTFSMPESGTALDWGLVTFADLVESSSDAVTGGKISDADTVITSGSLLLSVDDLDDDDLEKQLAAKASSAASVVAYLDIMLDNIVNQGAEDESWYTEVATTPTAITLTLTLSNSIANSASSFYIIREHEGNFQQAPATFDATAKTITFKTDKFSSYAIVKGSPGSSTTTSTSTTTPSTSTTTSGTSSTSLPKTGDTDRTTPYMITAICSLAVAAFALRRMRQIGY